MSGGSYNYISSRLLGECQNNMFDEEMNDLLIDFAKVLHDLEWWQSGDYGEEQYRETVREFKKKWFEPGSRKERLKSYIENQTGLFKAGLLRIIEE